MRMVRRMGLVVGIVGMLFCSGCVSTGGYSSYSDAQTQAEMSAMTGTLCDVMGAMTYADGDYRSAEGLSAMGNFFRSLGPY